MHTHASSFTKVTIPRWAARTPAGDVRAALATVQQRRHALTLDREQGWLGLVPGSTTLADLATEVARAAWSQATGRVALGLGSSKGDILTLLRQVTTATASPLATAPGTVSAIVASNLGLTTYLPCATAAACSTGLACLLAGADLIERGQADHALVGAVELSLSPLILASFANAGVLCGTTPPSAFATATGFAPAEGAAAFTLTANDPEAPYMLRAGVRLGDAGHETHFIDPRTLRIALAALWDLLPQPDLIVCHATGTALGDAYELAGLDQGPWSLVPRLCCKPWIGHSLGASGAVEFAIALETGARRIWKLSLGFGGHLVAVAAERQEPK